MSVKSCSILLVRGPRFAKISNYFAPVTFHSDILPATFFAFVVTCVLKARINHVQSIITMENCHNCEYVIVTAFRNVTKRTVYFSTIKKKERECIKKQFPENINFHM